MDLVSTTMLIYMGINILGLVWTAATIQFGIPEHLSIQNRPHKWAILMDRLPLVFLNQTILMVVVWAALTFYGEIFTMDAPGIGLLVLQVAIVVVLDFVMKTFVKVISVSDENVEVFSTIRDSV